ncbi:DUF4083 domain-containing protein [Halobacillus sp. A1]|uniref:DUF4083 domain-containing protein n=1 Tax=Halobacillus sp. A1 TaxID=2880262 RepID=UPI0020A6991D|nr:DUF4083 domain-containing protein [Halobacillus sp. A1]MCP3031536.1 DUF4083 domain-containing protein [Halobacillus sp. A1]
MLLLLTADSFHVGDIMFQLFFFIIIVAAVTGIVSYVKKEKNKNKQLHRMEQKLDELLERKK